MLFLFKLYLVEKKEYMYPVSNIGEECVFLNSEEDESRRELCNSMFLIKCGKSNSFMFHLCFLYAHVVFKNVSLVMGCSVWVFWGFIVVDTTKLSL